MLSIIICIIVAGIVSVALGLYMNDDLHIQSSSIDTSEWRYGDILADKDYFYFLIAVEGDKAVVIRFQRYKSYTISGTTIKMFDYIKGKITLSDMLNYIKHIGTEEIITVDDRMVYVDEFETISLNFRKELAEKERIKASFQQKMEIQTIIEQELKTLNDEDLTNIT